MRARSPRLSNVGSRPLVLLCLLFLPLLSSCALLQQILGGLPTPTADIKGVRFQDWSLQGVTLLFDVGVHNPYPVALPLANLDYKLASNAQPFLQGTAPLQGTVPPQGDQVLPIPARVNFAELFHALQGVKAGALVPYQGELGLSVNAPDVGPIRLPLQKQGQIPVPAAPDVSISGVQWEQLSLSGVRGVVKLHVGNTNEFPVDLAGLNYAVKLAGFDLVSGALNNVVSFAPGAAEDFPIPVEISAVKAGLGLLQLAKGNGGQYALSGNVGLKTAFGALSIPLEKVGQVAFGH